ncbi:MAG: DNA repair protein RecN [Ruminococcaceae bacterium]|nr:DNA repair protein RecN [Oscillospiraceae bacterium]
MKPLLSKIFIKNVAVIESAEIEFGQGFNILTGETGAGKSIIIDSFNLLKGQRADKDIIRTGESKARVDGVFTVDAETELALSDDYGIEPCDGEIVISREISSDGKNTARVNGLPVTSGVLKEIGEYLITIHGQHDNTSLLSKKTHLQLLDTAAGEDLAGTLAEYRAVHSEIIDKQAQLESVKSDEQEKIRRLDMLKFQIDEIEAASLENGEDEELSHKRAMLENAERIAESTQNAYSLLFEGDDRQKSANDLLWEGLGKIGEVAEYDGELQRVHEELTDLVYEVSDKIRSLRKYIDTLTYEPYELEQVEDRLDLIYNLKRKYGTTIELIKEYLADARAEADSIIRSDEIAAELDAELNALKKQREDLADKLTTLRTEFGDKLSARIEEQLADLDMAKVKFKVKIEECEYNSNGKDDVEFLICTNVGEEFKPLTKIASGGELSRIMLGMRNVLNDGDGRRTLVFDEIDAGVSGHAAQRIGEKLRAISSGSQVICITHLPQIAALATDHYLIEKNVQEGRTLTRVEHLDYESRVYELARTLGGATVTDITLANARELLKQADI